MNFLLCFEFFLVNGKKVFTHMDVIYTFSTIYFNYSFAVNQSFSFRTIPSFSFRTVPSFSFRTVPLC